MFPTNGMEMNPISPDTQTIRTTFPGGEAIQQSSSYSGQHGNTTFQYSSSSTSMSFSPGTQHLAQPTPLPPVRCVQQPALSVIASPQTVLVPEPNMPASPQPYTQMQRPLETRVHPRPQPQSPLHHVQAPIVELPPAQTPILEVHPTPEPIFHPTTANHAPQNKRLADSFKRELSEATYFSDIPGMPDRSVQQ